MRGQSLVSAMLWSVLSVSARYAPAFIGLLTQHHFRPRTSRESGTFEKGTGTVDFLTYRSAWHRRPPYSAEDAALWKT